MLKIAINSEKKGPYVRALLLLDIDLFIFLTRNQIDCWKAVVNYRHDRFAIVHMIPKAVNPMPTMKEVEASASVLNEIGQKRKGVFIHFCAVVISCSGLTSYIA